MPNCQALKTRLDGLLDARQGVLDELRAAPSGPERRELLAELRSLNAAVAAAQQQYAACLHPPPPKPDLVAKSFQVRPDRAAMTLAVAGVIQNDGDGPAQGPFDVTLGATYTDRHLTVITRQFTIHLDASVRIEGHGTQYVTPPIANLPLLYRSENPKFVYEFDMIVDSANQIAEVSESNNFVGLRYWVAGP